MDQGKFQAELACFSSKTCFPKKSFKDELQKDMIFSEIYGDTFVNMLITMNDYKRQKENIPSDKRLKRIRERWDNRIDVLQSLIGTCDFIKRRTWVFFKAIEAMKDFEVPAFTQDDEILLREEFEAKLNVTNVFLGEEFDKLTNFSEGGIRRWLSDFFMDNVEHNSIAKINVESYVELKNKYSPQGRKK